MYQLHTATQVASVLKMRIVYMLLYAALISYVRICKEKRTEMEIFRRGRDISFLLVIHNKKTGKFRV